MNSFFKKTKQKTFHDFSFLFDLSNYSMIYSHYTIQQLIVNKESLFRIQNSIQHVIHSIFCSIQPNNIHTNKKANNNKICSFHRRDRFTLLTIPPSNHTNLTRFACSLWPSSFVFISLLEGWVEIPDSHFRISVKSLDNSW